MDTSVVTLRRQLHQFPDLSGNEQKTAELVKAYFRTHGVGDFINDFGGAGFAVVHQFGSGGKTVVIRCELDALPIAEPNTFAWRSQHPGISHKCGHDGHMAIVASMLFWLREQSFLAGRVVLLFQPAEENGEGAAMVCQDHRLRALQPDYVFALHNIPGVPLGTVIGLPDHFSAEVISLKISLQGKEAHAAEPHQGRNPAFACARIIAALDKLAVPDTARPDFAVLTPVHCRVGQVAYGIAPGEAELHYTVRTWSEAPMVKLQARMVSSISEICADLDIGYGLDWREHFPASRNDPGANQMVREAAGMAGLDFLERPYPFTFGEDFGWFSRSYKTAMFGLGAGEETPALHHADYDFPDALLPVGSRMFAALITKLLLS
ncbi:MAG: amidohydrolase [Bacteroidota bacterium]